MIYWCKTKASSIEVRTSTSKELTLKKASVASAFSCWLTRQRLPRSRGLPRSSRFILGCPWNMACKIIWRSTSGKPVSVLSAGTPGGTGPGGIGAGGGGGGGGGARPRTRPLRSLRPLAAIASTRSAPRDNSIFACDARL